MSDEGPSSDPSASDTSGAPLPACPYRSAERDGRFPCAAAEGAPVTGAECRSCPIPEALAHKKACMYLVPLREEGRSIFACRCYSTQLTVLAAKDWRRLCFCNYWFPRGPADRMFAPQFAEARNQYRRVLRDEGSKPSRGPAQEAPPEKKQPGNPVLRWLQWQWNWWLR